MLLVQSLVLELQIRNITTEELMDEKKKKKKRGCAWCGHGKNRHYSSIGCIGNAECGGCPCDEYVKKEND